MRDSLDSGVGDGDGIASDQELMGLVLQEADSTTVDHTYPNHAHPTVAEMAILESGNGIAAAGGANVFMPREGPGCEESEMVEQEGVKKVCRIDVVEGGDVLPKDVGGSGGEVDIALGGRRHHEVDSALSGGGMEMGEVGGVEMETVQRKEPYKEAATGQVESETQSKWVWSVRKSGVY